jgi:hypothetical protein
MRRSVIAMGLVAGWAASVGLPARAEPPRIPAVTVSASAAPATRGVVVVAAAGATDAAWPLAQALYGDASLRPVGLDEAHARVLCGEAPASGAAGAADAGAAPAAAQELRDLADTVAAVRGEDAPSRALLAEIARRWAVAAVVVVHAEGGQPPTARVFVSDSRDFDGATYTPDSAPGLGWSAAVRSLARSFGRPAGSQPMPAATGTASSAPPPSAAAPATAPRLATRDAPKRAESKTSRPFYVSPWFWGALGVAALAGGTAYLLSRDTSPSTIHLQVQGPQ